jgi:RimJ/RimL family protein N-acetyltransferase
MQLGATADARGRLPGPPGMTVACARDGRAAWIAGDVPATAAMDALTVIESAPALDQSGVIPEELDRCERILSAACGRMGRTTGPYYLFERDLTESSVAHGCRIQRSDEAPNEVLSAANPGNWHPVEWRELLDGRLGPWAIALQDDRVISICHTPRTMTDRTAECGVWTDPAFRSRGLAAAVSAAWAAVVRPTGRHLFYSTSDANLSSQRVAERLGLRRIGWVWQVRAAEAEAAPDVHPLSRLSTR